ncbi:MAG: M48 family metallopeptidase [Deltaproteobacteria bacterium]|nr:M48 family metallopeptidase [Deltaproteobacteria bacterium]
MKIVNRQPQTTADVSSARGTAGKEFRQLVLAALVVLVAVYFIVGLTVDLVVSRISFETETRIFKHVQVPVPTEQDASRSKSLQRAEEILAKLRKNPTVPPLPYRLVLIEDEKPNAFALPGGTIGVTTGLLAVLDEEVEVAFVLGHELGHFYHRDHLEGMGRAIGFQIILALFSSGSGAESFGNVVEFALQRGYSRKREKMADRFGLELVHATYGNVKGVERLFQILLDERTLPGWAYMFLTHPSPGERIADLESFAATLGRQQLEP